MPIRHFVLKNCAPSSATEHVLLVQWDGYVVNPGAWDPAFLECDYLGAKWFWHEDGMRVGNGGFSLRSRRLLAALEDPRIVLVEAEDTTIGRTFRPLLEREHGIRFGSEALADKFAFEAAYPIGKPFGFHGLFNFWQVMPPAELAALTALFSDGIARSVQLGHLLNNCVTAGQWVPAIAIARRILAADPSRDNVRALLAQAEGNAARGVGVGRNDPCPCGSGKRYKQCHGAVGSAAPTRLGGAAAFADAGCAGRTRHAGAPARGPGRRRARLPRGACDGAGAPCRVALPRRDPLPAQPLRRRAAAARTRRRARPRGTGVPQQPGARRSPPSTVRTTPSRSIGRRWRESPT